MDNARRSGTYPAVDIETNGPGLVKTRLEKASDITTEILNRVCRKYHISERDLASIIDGSPSLGRKKLLDERPFNVRELLLFPRRQRLELFSALMAVDDEELLESA